MGFGRFPFVRFGTCPVCGGTGPDDPDASGADASASRTALTDRAAVADADADVNVSAANGYRLYWYKGELMCEMCIKEKKADDESLLAASKHAETEEFLAKSGFVREVADE